MLDIARQLDLILRYLIAVKDMTISYAPQFTHVTRAFLTFRHVQHVLCWQLYLDTESGSHMSSAGSCTVCPCTGVVPVLYLCRTRTPTVILPLLRQSSV